MYSWETFYTRSLEHIASKSKPTEDIETSHEPEQEQQDSDNESNDDDDDDPGTSWFSEHDAPGKVLRYMTSRKFPLSPRRNPNARLSILDLGTGNGSMLALLRKRGGFKGAMVGVDYSAQSVLLARELQRLKLHSAYESGSDDDDDDYEEEEEEEEDGEHEDVVVAAPSDNNNANGVVHEAIPLQEQDIRFEEWDILDPANEDILSHAQDDKNLPWFPYETRGFDVVLDKGTFDAISLLDETQAGEVTAATHTCHKYPIVAAQLVRPGGYLIVTSCNWTEEELVRWFTASSTQELEVWHRLEYPRFRFGGHEGQGVCTVCFRRRV